MFDTIIVEKEDPVLAPVVADRQEQEVLPGPWMERVGNPDGSGRIMLIRGS
jgi:hypothetical protein